MSRSPVSPSEHLEFVRVARVAELSSERPLQVHPGDFNAVVFRLGDEVYAVENNCPHQHFSVLHEGRFDQGIVTCPMHGWSFDVRTGISTNGQGRLRTLQVRISGDEIWLACPA